MKGQKMMLKIKMKKILVYTEDDVENKIGNPKGHHFDILNVVSSKPEY
jgi:hypothetical protein